jgi:hypothetical protein
MPIFGKIKISEELLIKRYHSEKVFNTNCYSNITG